MLTAPQAPKPLGSQSQGSRPQGSKPQGSKPRSLLRRLGFSRLVIDQMVRRAVFLLGGLCVGGVAVLMALSADKAQQLFQWMLHGWHGAAFALSPGGFALCALLARTVFPNSQGSGIPQVIAARAIEDGQRRMALVSLRTAVGKIVVMLIGLACGASIMGFIGRKAPIVYQQNLLLAGAAAGIAAAFNTPLAGIVFGIEELSRSFEAKSSGLVIGCIIAAGVTSLALLGDYTYFGSTASTLPLGRAWLVVPVLAATGGLLGGVFSRIVLVCLIGDPASRLRRFITARPILFAALCGLGVALCGMAGHHSSYGTGYEEASAILHGTDELTPLFMPAKFLATVFSSIAGIPGGLFAPSLSIGAGLGAEFHALFAGVPVGALALIGMCAYLAGVVQTPITSFVIVSEMTQDHAMVIPLMVAALIADAASRLVCKDGIYHALSHAFLPPAAEPNRTTAAEPA